MVVNAVVVAVPVMVGTMITSPLKIRLEGPPVPPLWVGDPLSPVAEPMNLNVMVDKLLKSVDGSVIDVVEPEVNVPIDVA